VNISLNVSGGISEAVTDGHIRIVGLLLINPLSNLMCPKHLLSVFAEVHHVTVWFTTKIVRGVMDILKADG